jgi:hypothetical protein
MSKITSARQILEGLLPQWHLLLQHWSANGEFVAAASEALQLDEKPVQLKALVRKWASGDFSDLPPIELLSSKDMPMAAGAYAIRSNTIYLNVDWLASANRNEAISVLTEELGHHLDGLLNAIDTPGDEGEYLARLVLKREVSPETKSLLREENDNYEIKTTKRKLTAEAAILVRTQIATNGSAKIDSSHPTNKIELLSIKQSFGSAWWTKPVDLSHDWDTSFAVTAFNGTGTSEGFTFTINGDSRGLKAIGDGGQSLGFFGSTSKTGIRNSYAVIFDTWATQPANLLGFSPSISGSFRQGSISLPISLTNNSYQVKISYLTRSKDLSVTIGGETYHQSIDLRALIGDKAYLGFTAANGSGSMDTDINTWDVDAVEPLPVISLSISSETVTEDGIGNLLYIFSRTGVITNALSVNFTVGGTAKLGIDYSGIMNKTAIKTVIFSPNSATATITVDPTADTIVEDNETVSLALVAHSDYLISTSAAVTGRISNDDVQAGVSTTLIGDQSTLTLSGTRRVNGTGNALNNIIIGNTNNNRLTGGSGKDILTGGGSIDSDTFAFYALNESLLSGFDTITDFSSRDHIIGPDSLETSTLFTSLGNASSVTASSIASVLSAPTFAANSAAAFTATGYLGTFIALNDARSGFQSESDSIIFLQGFNLRSGNYIDLI